MCSKKNFYNPSDPRDAEELLNYLETLESDDELAENIDRCRELDFVLVPPDDGNDTDQDDANSDLEENANFRDIGKGVLSQPMVVVGRSQQGTQDIMQVNNNEATIDDDDYSDSDEQPLAKKVKIKKKNKLSRKRETKKRVWKQQELEARNTRIEALKNCEPNVIQKKRLRRYNPQDIGRFRVLIT